MGVLQVVVLGDFYHPPPVPNVWTRVGGDFCFKSALWSTLFPHMNILQKVHRQDDPICINAISETARGCPSAENVSFMSLDNDIQRSKYLYSRRADVYIRNHEKLLEMPGEMKLFHRTDNASVSPKVRNSVDAPSKPWLKIEAPVILTVNLSSVLVNGLLGHVASLFVNSVTVHFKDLCQEHEIIHHDYFQYIDGRTVFVCSQLHILLAFAVCGLQGRILVLARYQWLWDM